MRRDAWMGTFDPGHLALALVMAALGARGLVAGDFASVWQRIPIEHLPARAFFAYASAAVELVAGLGMLWRRSVVPASAMLVVFVALWAVLLKMPAVLYAPGMEATWLGLGEITVILAGSWMVFARQAGAWSRRHLAWLVGAPGVRGARWLLALSLPMIGLSHFFYPVETAGFVPGWLPQPVLWGYLTGACSLAAALAIASGVLAGLAARLEALMLGVITLLVWGPGLVTAPSDHALTAFLMSSAIACGAWAVADSWRGERAAL